MKNHPNTYTFTKALAEQVVNDFKNKIPVVIYRPSIGKYNILYNKTKLQLS